MKTLCRYAVKVRSYLIQGVLSNLCVAAERTYIKGVDALQTTPHKADGESGRALDQTDHDDLRHNLRISVWVRWLATIAWLVQLNYRPNFAEPSYFLHTSFALLLLALNAYVHYRIQSGRRVTWHWALALSTMDGAMITAGLAISTGFGNNFFVLYYPALAMFAVVFTSVWLSFAGATIVAVAYTALSIWVEPGVDFEIKEEKVLFTRIVVMYAVVFAVNLVSRFERIRRIEAVERERAVHQGRIESSRRLHDTTAQSAFVVGLGLETAKELAEANTEESRKDLVAKLDATHDLSRSIMWDLRHPIEAGPIFEGRSLASVLESHASSFATITSIPTRVVVSGQEPALTTITKELLFSIAHNALTNTFRHSQAENVTIALIFADDGLEMVVSDNGTGLQDGSESLGRGFSNMRVSIEQLGGTLDVTSGQARQGTTVSCLIPKPANSGDA